MQTSSSTDMVVDAVGKDGSKGKSKAGQGKSNETLWKTSATSVAGKDIASARLLVQRHLKGAKESALPKGRW